MKNKKFRLDLIIKGIMMGSADIVPGVSGGTLALITGIYKELVASIHAVGTKTFLAPFLLMIPNRRAEGLEELRAINWGFLIPLGLGVVTAILSLSRVIPYLLEEYPLAMYSLFFGLIVASVIFPWRMVKTRGLELALAFAGGLFAFTLSGAETLATGSLHPAYVFICGAIAITAMILPGISGSYLLVILGEYKLILESIHERRILTIAIFMLGIVVGILSFSRVLNWLLTHRLSPTMAVLAGFMVGSLRKVWPGQYFTSASGTSQDWLIATTFTGLGLSIVIALEVWGKRGRPPADGPASH